MQVSSVAAACTEGFQVKLLFQMGQATNASRLRMTNKPVFRDRSRSFEGTQVHVPVLACPNEEDVHLIARVYGSSSARWYPAQGSRP